MAVVSLPVQAALSGRPNEQHGVWGWLCQYKANPQHPKKAERGGMHLDSLKWRGGGGMGP